MRKLLFVVFSLASLHVAAQKNLWFPGVVVTVNDEVISGEILFHSLEDVVVIRHDTISRVLSSILVKSFRMYDHLANINRKFISIPVERESGRKKIYEVVLYGAIPVIRRLKNAMDGGFDESEFVYYFIQDGETKSLKQFRKALYPSLHEQLSMREKELHLNPNSMADAIRFIELYNQSSAILASR